MVHPRYPGALKSVVSGPGYDQAMAVLGSLAAATDTQLAPYAAHTFEYDGSRRVTKEVAGGLGCSACAGGLGTYTYAYTTSSNEAGTNSWRTKTVETLPDGTTNTVYTNSYAQVMLVATSTGGSPWLQYYRYDTSAQPVLAAAPSAVSGYSDGYADLVNYVAGNARYLRDGEGVLTAYTYGASTAATSSAAGHVAGLPKSVALLRGEVGAPVPQSDLAYLERTAGGIDLYVPATSTVYRNDNGTGAQTTTLLYTWQGSTARPASVTVTLPVVSAGQNGAGAATAATVVSDAYGRPVWAKDAAGFLAYTEYDTASGAVVKTMVVA